MSKRYYIAGVGGPGSEYTDIKAVLLEDSPASRAFFRRLHSLLRHNQMQETAVSSLLASGKCYLTWVTEVPDSWQEALERTRNFDCSFEDILDDSHSWVEMPTEMGLTTHDVAQARGYSGVEVYNWMLHGTFREKHSENLVETPPFPEGLWDTSIEETA